MPASCPLCSGNSIDIKLIKNAGQTYYDCHRCGLIFLEPSHHLTQAEEKQFYLTHNNDVHDIRYQNFVSPITEFVQGNLSKGSRGLDFGAGTGPVITHLLEKSGYEMALYDPYFHDEKEHLERAYDFIVSCEVVEHFCSPQTEFEKLSRLLKPQAPLAIMTLIYGDSTDFASWFYHQDPTHVGFYRARTFDWIQNRFNFRRAEILSPRLCCLWK